MCFFIFYRWNNWVTNQYPGCVYVTITYWVSTGNLKQFTKSYAHRNRFNWHGPVCVWLLSIFQMKIYFYCTEMNFVRLHEFTLFAMAIHSPVLNTFIKIHFTGCVHTLHPPLLISFTPSLSLYIYHLIYKYMIMLCHNM